MSFLEKKVCPFCLNVLNKNTAKYYCECGKVATKPKFWRKLHCSDPNCRLQRFKLLCAQKDCGRELPINIMQYQAYLRFSVIGLSGVGKTNYITAMLHEMKEGPAAKDWTIGHMDNLTLEEYDKHRKSMFDENKSADPTPPGYIITQQWYLKKATTTSYNVPTYSLTLFDGAGEDYREVNPLVAKCIQGSKTIVILFDPLTITEVGNALDPNVFDCSRGSLDRAMTATDMLNSIVEYIRKNLMMKPGQRIDKDVAVVFTKIDTLAHEFTNARVMKPSPHIQRHGFVVEDMETVNEEIRSWLERKEQNAFLSAIKGNFYDNRVRFFGVSSFGHPPISRIDNTTVECGEITPHRVLDPLMWMMYQEKILKKVRL